MASEHIQPAPEPAEDLSDSGSGMARPRWHLPWWAALLGVGPLAVLARPFAAWLSQPTLHNPLVHVLSGLAAAGLGVVLALLVLHVAGRATDSRIFLVGMGFLSIASIFITHAVATPSVLISGRELATSFSAVWSLALGSAFFALSGLNLAPRTNARLMRFARLILLAYLGFWLVYNWAFLLAIPRMLAELAPAASHAAHTPANGAAPAPLAALLSQANPWLVLISLICYGFAAVRHYRLYTRAPSQFGLALTCGTVLFGEALLTQFYAAVYSPLFWLYHAQEFLGFGMISYAVLVGYRRGANRESLLESLLLTGTRARLQASYIGAMDALVDAIERGDRPAPALRAELRQRIGLTESQVQVFERAARAIAQERRQRQELERLNAALRQLEAYKTQLTQMVVHDLKNPLTALLAYLDVLNISELSDDQRDLLAGAVRSSRNLSDLIGDLLDIARLEEGQLDLDYSEFGVQDLLRDSVDAMRGWLAQDGKVTEISAPAEPVLVDADLRLVRRALSNLLSNAIKHTPSGTHISLRVSPLPAGPGQPAQVAIEVADDGPGIPADRLERIFERFGSFAAQPIGARQSSTGLGLTLCRLVAEAHGGSISVVSSVGAGSTFRLLLPAHAAGSHG